MQRLGGGTTCVCTHSVSCARLDRVSSVMDVSCELVTSYGKWPGGQHTRRWRAPRTQKRLLTAGARYRRPGGAGQAGAWLGGAWRECGSDSAAGPAAGSVGATQRGCFLACDARRETERAKSDAESSTDPLLPSFLSSPRCQHPSLRLYFVSICSNSGFSKKPRPAISIGPLAKGCLVRGIPPQWPDPRRGLEHMARKCLCSADGYTELRCFSPSQQISPGGTSCPRKHVNSICKALLLIQFSPVPMDLTIQRILKCLLCPQLDPSACFELHKSNRLMNMVNRTCFCWFCVEEGRWDSHLCARERQTRRVTD